ncbi:hypothetical protein [Mycobacterium paraterrae]|uniref:Uncharacterized protein n=1 Tax=Mycobacterium paraterrae TaxID=577492 RepID=A0ABY3VQ66_9MYCO|nr:hypothetical protein [Mycobacterium paraterrae]UMB69316.1 hypothetical protein MKK62_23680 [Mycobacterium paraterrae]
MPNEPAIPDLDFALLDSESVTRTSTDHSAEKSLKPLQFAADSRSHSATEDTVDIERKK